MNKFFLTIFLGALSLFANAQLNRKEQQYGKTSMADLDMKTCDFEKDANAEVLFKKGIVYFDQEFNIIMDVHKRIKIFNDNGKKAADIHIPYYSGNHLEYVSGVQAETINLTDGKTEITKLEKNLIYDKSIDKNHREVVFSFANVKPGSIIEYKYTIRTLSVFNFPDWYFQEKAPVRYSEVTTEIPEFFYYRANSKTDSHYAKDSTFTKTGTFGTGADAKTFGVEGEVRTMTNIASLPDEPYMSSDNDNLKSILFQLVTIKPVYGYVSSGSDTWEKVGGILIEDEDFGGQLKRKLKEEEVIINKAKALKTQDEKIAYIFNEVKNSMKWNGVDRWYTDDGTPKAWETKTGNSTEINLILYHLLKQSGVDAYPMVVSTRKHGKVRPYLTSLVQFNRAVVYVPVDSNKNYVLDASSKYNLYFETPSELLNSSGLYVDKANKKYDIIFLEKKNPAQRSIVINAEIKPGGKVDGTAQISSTSYDRINAKEKYTTDGEKKYIDYLRDDNNSLKISSIKFENMDVDTLPLQQTVAFNLDLAGSDENYIYFSPNLFSSIKDNPFLSESRMTDIDFGYRRTFNIIGTFKIPAGYKTDAIPQNTGIAIEDKSLIFKRIMVVQGNVINVRYSIEYKNPIYFKTNYPDLHEFFKKMHELLSEQIVLKKA